MKKFLIIFITVAFATTGSAQKNEFLKDIIAKCQFEPMSIDINKDNTQLIIGGKNKTVIIYDLIKKKKIFEIEAHYLPVEEVKFSNIHNGFYSVGDKSFKLWLNDTEKPETIYIGSHTSITDWDTTPLEDYFVGGSYEKKIRYWSSSLPTEPKVIETGHKKNVISVALSTNNKLIASGSLDSTIEIWNTSNLSRKIKILAHALPVCCLDFIKNDRQLLSASHDGYIKLWDVDSGKVIKVYRGHTKAINAINISPNEQFLLSASYDGTVNLYSIFTGDLIQRFSLNNSPVFDVKWNINGTGFYCCKQDGQILEWSIPKQIYANHFFGNEINKELENTALFRPKRKNESKEDFNLKLERANKLKIKLIDKYYQKVLELPQNITTHQ